MKTIATIWKEFLTLLRDPGGVAMIFLMPVLLVTVMSLVQDAPFRDYRQFRFDILCVNDDKDSLGIWMEQSLAQSGAFAMVKEINGKAISKEEAAALVNTGKYKAMIYIPAGATKHVSTSTGIVVQTLMSGFGVTEKPAKANLENVEIKLFFDPVIQANLRQSLLFGVEKIAAAAENKLLMRKFTEQIKTMTGSEADSSLTTLDMSKMVTVAEQRGSIGIDESAMNSVQHNVPAWTMFAMFFIVFPLAGNFIKEREDGSLLRIRLISGSPFPFIFGKYVFHFIICMIQFVLMMGVGLYLLPHLGLPKLTIGNRVGEIVLAAAAISMAATAFGMLIATFFKTHNQALAFSSVVVVVLAAIGGVWVPVYVMPEIMQTISKISPLAWGLDLCNSIFLRNVSVIDLLPALSKLIGFSLACLGLSYYFYSKRMLK